MTLCGCVLPVQPRAYGLVMLVQTTETLHWAEGPCVSVSCLPETLHWGLIDLGANWVYPRVGIYLRVSIKIESVN